VPYKPYQRDNIDYDGFYMLHFPLDTLGTVENKTILLIGREEAHFVADLIRKTLREPVIVEPRPDIKDVSQH
jgi:hypothetical protein